MTGIASSHLIPRLPLSKARAGDGWPRRGAASAPALRVLTPLVLAVFVANVSGAQQQTASQPFATVNGETILFSTYQTVLHIGGRQRFYHGKAPEAELEAYRRELGQHLVDQALMHQEALRRGIEPNRGRVQAELGKVVQRYGQSPDWAVNEARVLPSLRQGLERGDRVLQLEEQWRNAVRLPDELQLRAYYRDNPDVFTSPPRSQVSMILLRVEPWAGKPEWDRQLGEGKRIHEEILNGLAFAEAARRYSADPSAANGGDMGYLHQWMLGSKAEEAVGALRQGQVSEPVVLLEGIALFHLVARTEARLNPFDQVRERAGKLWLRERREEAVTLGKQKLREAAEIHFANPRYFELQPQYNGRSGGTAS
jgi:parvulin-like peptidyl-prolyl isomerase